MKMKATRMLYAPEFANRSGWASDSGPSTAFPQRQQIRSPAASSASHPAHRGGSVTGRIMKHSFPRLWEIEEVVGRITQRISRGFIIGQEVFAVIGQSFQVRAREAFRSRHHRGQVHLRN